jgi:hypothetical protein
MSAARAVLRQWRGSADLVFVALCASLLFAVSLPDVDLSRMTDLGLVSVIPFSLVLALGALTVSFCLCLHHARNTAVLLLHVIALVVMLYGVTTLVAEVPRFNVAWRHVGVADYIVRTGDVAPGIDVYFNWPGFFVGAAFVSELTGVGLPTLANWAPVAFNLLYLAPLLLILRTATDDERLAWLGVWFFYLTNWIGQDYFSPQGATYFLYLVVLAVLLRWFASVPARRLLRLRPRREPQPEPVPPGAEPSPAQRAGLVAVVVVLFAAMVSGHQLMPFMVVASVAALVFAGRCTVRGLPVLMLVMIGTWIAFLAVAYVNGHLDTVLADLGDLRKSVDSTTNRVEGTAEHLLVVRVRMLLTLFIWMLALLGALRALRRGRRDVSLALLAVVPFALIGFAPYGGEILLRIYLFALPFVAFFAAALFYPVRAAGRSWRTTRAVLLVSVALLGGFSVARYGNERMDQFSQAELDAVNRLYDLAPRGSLLVAGDANLPWRFRDYERYRYELLTKTESWRRMNWKRPRPNAVVREIAAVMAAAQPRAFLILTRSQQAGVELLGLAPRGALWRIRREVAASPRFELVYRNADAAIFTLRQPRRAGA